MQHKDMRKVYGESLRRDDGLAHRSLLSEAGVKTLQAANIKEGANKS